MTTNYIFVDFENVQPKSVLKLTGQPFQVMVFVGFHQNNIPLGLAQTLQPLGISVEYIQISGKGPEVLDFHLAYYLGQMVERDPAGYFHIISKDTGFDVLVDHLRAKKVFVRRSVDISEIPILNPPTKLNTDEKYLLIKKHLKGRPNSKPSKEPALRNSINAIFQKELSDMEIDRFCAKLKSDKLVKVIEGKLCWSEFP